MDELRERINKILEKYNHAVHDHCVDEILAALPAPLDMGEVKKELFDVWRKVRIEGRCNTPVDGVVMAEQARAICARFGVPRVEWPEEAVAGEDNELIKSVVAQINDMRSACIAAYERAMKARGNG